ncbi:MAG: hypothetical protein HYY68_09065 [Thaumarchaeota archaeon]|nr:hypothetical protein [Nitrososphaerota archaeon]
MRGWILDLYPGNPGEMVVWLKLENGDTKRLVDRWTPSVFVASDDKSDLELLTKAKQVARGVLWSRSVKKYEQITDQDKSEVLEFIGKDAKKNLKLARAVERLGAFGRYRIYNADVPPNQMYLYEHDLFPLAYCEVSESTQGLSWALMDDVWALDYRLPNFRSANVKVSVNKEGRIPKFTDPVEAISIESDDEKITLSSGSEQDRILGMVEAVKRLDPDFIFTENGDAFVLPYLITRAEKNGVERFALDRDETVLRLPAKAGTSYFSYGKILFKPSAMKLYGRVHLDMVSSFVCNESGPDGLFELSRICRLPLQTSSRASIGKALSSLQFYHATKQDILIPWKPILAEHFKDRSELLVADRGGFIFEPKVGLHENVAELDFSALYPNIMLKKNLSAETVRCSCCPDSYNRVPELDWNVCERRRGIVSTAMKIIVGKRLQYKRLKKEAKEDVERRKYDSRQGVLKWLGVTCLPRESFVSIKRNGKVECVKIGDFIDSIVGNRTGAIDCPPDIFVAGLGHNLKTKYCKLRKLIRTLRRNKLLSITAEDGRKIIATSDHPFFVLDNGQLEVRTACELKVGDLIPVTRSVPSHSKKIESVDLIERLDRRLSLDEQSVWRVSGAALKERIVANKQRLHKEAAASGYTYQAVPAWAKSGIIPFRFFHLLDVQHELRKKLRIGVGRRPGGRIAWLPAVLPLNEELGFFLGLFVADGSASGNCIRLDIGLSQADLLENARVVVESIFGISPHIYKERKARMYVLQINHVGLIRVLERVFDLPGSTEKGKLKVPGILFNSDESAAQGFTQGLIAGDGYPSKRRNFTSIATASKDFQIQIGFLSAKLGLTFRNAQHRHGNHPLYSVNFVGPETLRKITNWRFLKDSHEELGSRIRDVCEETCTHSRYQAFPVSESGLLTLARVTKSVRNPRIDRRSRTCPTKVGEAIRGIGARRLDEKREAQLQAIRQLFESDLCFARVRKIETLERDDEYVYCFQLDDNELPGFFAGEGLVYVHNCFGYLGFNNAKFGRIDAHIGVCAWDRKILLDSARIAERGGFEVIHGIVDCLWVRKESADESDYLKLASEIQTETGFEISFEGVYKWIAFVPSKVTSILPVLNRYYGAYRNGELKVRGIEARRHDTPLIFSRCQMEILSLLAKADSVDQAREMIPDCVDIFVRYAMAIQNQEVPIEQMVFTRNISKKPDEYTSRTVEAGVAKQLAREGVELHAGEQVRYVITDYCSTSSERRAMAFDLADGRTAYDSRRYIELLGEVCSAILEPFDQRCRAEQMLQVFKYENHILAL